MERRGARLRLIGSACIVRWMEQQIDPGGDVEVDSTALLVLEADQVVIDLLKPRRVFLRE